METEIVNYGYTVELGRYEDYTKIAEALLLEAKNERKGRRVEGYRDNKHLITVKGIEALLGVRETKIISLNSPISKNVGASYHEVLYGDHTFIATSPNPHVFIIESFRTRL
ncbi:hypothetical protein FJZ21_03380 [Candidatus Pacearchaeota archaeon]|nr:hypothetical protein [Candidatus Pacearchaeota archaeon]